MGFVAWQDTKTIPFTLCRIQSHTAHANSTLDMVSNTHELASLPVALQDPSAPQPSQLALYNLIFNPFLNSKLLTTDNLYKCG